MTPATFLRRSATLFAVLAWISMVAQVIYGLALLVFGGAPVPLGGAEIPARLASLIAFFGAALNWFLLMFISRLTRLLREIHARVTGGVAPSKS